MTSFQWTTDTKKIQDIDEKLYRYQSRSIKQVQYAVPLTDDKGIAIGATRQRRNRARQEWLQDQLERRKAGCEIARIIVVKSTEDLDFAMWWIKLALEIEGEEYVRCVWEGNILPELRQKAFTLFTLKDNGQQVHVSRYTRVGKLYQIRHELISDKREDYTRYMNVYRHIHAKSLPAKTFFDELAGRWIIRSIQEPHEVNKLYDELLNDAISQLEDFTSKLRLAKAVLMQRALNASFEREKARHHVLESLRGKRKAVCPRCGQEGYVEWKSPRAVYIRHRVKDSLGKIRLTSHYYNPLTAPELDENVT